MGLTSRLAGLSLLEVAEASSPGPGKVEPRSRLSPYPKAAAFAGGAISEGEEEDEDDEVCLVYIECSFRVRREDRGGDTGVLIVLCLVNPAAG